MSDKPLDFAWPMHGSDGTGEGIRMLGRAHLAELRRRLLMLLLQCVKLSPQRSDLQHTSRMCQQDGRHDTIRFQRACLLSQQRNPFSSVPGAALHLTDRLPQREIDTLY